MTPDTVRGRHAPSAQPAVAAASTCESAARPLSMLANSIGVMVGKAGEMALGFLFWVIAARQFAPEQVGLAAGAVAAMMLCTQLAQLGVGSALITTLPRHLHAPAQLLNTAFTIVGTVAAVIGAAFLLLATGVLPELGAVASRPSFAALFLAMTVLGTLGIAFDQTSIALRRGDHVMVRGLAFGLVTVGLIVLLPRVTDADGAIVIFSPWVAAGGTFCAIAAVQIGRSLHGYRYRPGLDRGQAPSLVRIGLPNWLLTLTERAPGLMLPIVVTELLTPAANATWYAVWMMAWAVFIVPISVGLALFAEISNSPEEAERMVWRAVRSSFVLGLGTAAGVALFAPYVLMLLGEHYASSGTTPLRILVLGVVPLCLVQAYFGMCRARQTFGEAIATGLAGGIASVAAAALGGAAYGLVGMAVAWLVVQTTMAAWAAWRLRVATRGSAATAENDAEDVGGAEPRPTLAARPKHRYPRPPLSTLGSPGNVAAFPGQTRLGSQASAARSEPSWHARGPQHVDDGAPALALSLSVEAMPLGPADTPSVSNVVHLVDRGLLPHPTPGGLAGSAGFPSAPGPELRRILEARPRSELAALSVVLESHVEGVSTPKVDALVERLGLENVTRAGVSVLCSDLDRQVASFRERQLEGAFPYLWLDASTLPVRDDGVVRSMPLAIASAVHESGFRQIVGVELVDADGPEFWPAFLRSLRSRGLAGVHLTVSDAYEGVREAAVDVLRSRWQRSAPQLNRSLLGLVPPKERELVSAGLKEVVDADTCEDARQWLEELVELLSAVAPSAGAALEHAANHLIAYHDFPRAHHAKLRSTEPLARLGHQVERQIELVGIFPNRSAALRVAAMLLVEQSDEWLAGRRYMTRESLAFVGELEAAPAAPVEEPITFPTAPPTAAAAPQPTLVPPAPTAEPEATLAPPERTRSLHVSARAAALAPFLAVAGIVGLWAMSLRTVELERMNDLGLVSVLPPLALVAFGLLTASFCLALRRPEPSGALLFAHVVALVVMLFGLAPLVEEVPRFAVTWRHIGVTESIARTATIDPSIDAYFNWPGFFVLSAFVADLAGIHDLSRVVAWAPVLFNLLYLAPLLVILRSAMASERLCWIGAWLFFLTNWIGQDYFAPQAMAFFLYLVVLAVVVRWFQTTRQAEATGPALRAVAWASPTRGRLRGRLASIWSQDLADVPATPPAAVRAGLAALVIVLAAALVTGHQLTPFALLLGLALLVVVRRCTLRGLPVLLAFLIGTWLSFMAIKYVRGHLETLVGNLGDIEQSLHANVGDRLGGSVHHEMVVRARLLMTASVWVLGLTGLVHSLRRGRPRIAFAVLAGAPLALVALQPYGGEVLLRAYLFGLPFVVYYVATLFAPAPGTPASWPRIGALGILSSVLVLGILVTRYGNERMDYFTQAEVAAVEDVYAGAPPGSRLVAVASSLPWKFRDYEKFRYEILSDSDAWSGVERPQPRIRRIAARTIRHLLKNRVETYLIVTRSQRAELQVLGYPPGLLPSVERALADAPGFDLVHDSDDAKVWRFRPAIRSRT